MASDKLYMDLTGTTGLAPRWFGDEGDTIAQYPQYRYLGKEGQTVAGTFNPERRYGFMTPATASYTTLTPATSSFSKQWRATVFDPYTGTAFYGENGANIWGKTDTVGSFPTALTQLAVTNGTAVTDLEIYQINGIRKVFFAYQGNTGGNIGYFDLQSANALTSPVAPITQTVLTVSSVDTGTNNISFVSGGFANDNRVSLYSTSSVPSPLVQGQVYYTVNTNVASHVAQVSLTLGGSAIDITTTGSGTITMANSPFTEWLSGSASGAFHTGISNDVFMVASDNGFMYIGDGNAVHKVDGTALTGGTNGTVTQNVLITAQTYVFTDAIDFKGFTWFTVVDSPLSNSNEDSFSGTTCGVYVWDRQTTIANMDDFIPIKGVKDIKKIYVTQAGKVRILCLSSKRTTQIREYNGAVFEVIEEAHLVSYPLYRDSLATAGNLTYWFGNDGRMYAHGYLVPGADEHLYLIGDMTNVPVSSFSTGAILFVDANSSNTVTRTAVDFSINDNGTIKNRTWYPNTVGNVPATGNVYSLVKYFPYPAKVNYVRIYHNAGNTSGTTQQGILNIYLNQATTPNLTASITRGDIAKGWKYIPVNLGAKNGIFSIQFSISWANVTTADATDWMPRNVEIDYEPLTKLL